MSATGDALHPCVHPSQLSHTRVRTRGGELTSSRSKPLCSSSPLHTMEYRFRRRFTSCRDSESSTSSSHRHDATAELFTPASSRVRRRTARAVTHHRSVAQRTTSQGHAHLRCQRRPLVASRWRRSRSSSPHLTRSPPRPPLHRRAAGAAMPPRLAPHHGEQALWTARRRRRHQRGLLPASLLRQLRTPLRTARHHGHHRHCVLHACLLRQPLTPQQTPRTRACTVDRGGRRVPAPAPAARGCTRSPTA
jgi:hypothetical protein